MVLKLFLSLLHIEEKSNIYLLEWLEHFLVWTLKCVRWQTAPSVLPESQSRFISRLWTRQILALMENKFAFVITVSSIVHSPGRCPTAHPDPCRCRCQTKCAECAFCKVAPGALARMGLFAFGEFIVCIGTGWLMIYEVIVRNYSVVLNMNNRFSCSCFTNTAGRLAFAVLRRK